MADQTGIHDISLFWEVWAQRRCLLSNEHVFDSTPTVEDFQWCLDRNPFCPSALFREWSNAFYSATEDIKKTLRALGPAALVYDGMPDATIDTKILTRPLVSTRWAQDCIL